MSPVTWHFCLLGLRTVSSKMSIPFGARATQLSLLVFPHSWSICQCLLQCLVSRWPQLLSWNTHTDRQLHHLVEVWQVKSRERYFSYLAKLGSLRILEYILGAQIFFFAIFGGVRECSKTHFPDRKVFKCPRPQREFFILFTTTHCASLSCCHGSSKPSCFATNVGALNESPPWSSSLLAQWLNLLIPVLSNE